MLLLGGIGADASFRDVENCRVDAVNAVLREVRHLESESIWYSRATRHQRHGPGPCRPPRDDCRFDPSACVESSSEAGQLLKPIITCLGFAAETGAARRGPTAPQQCVFTTSD